MKRVGNYYVPDNETLQNDALAAGGWQIGHLDAALAHVTDWSCAVDGGAHVGSWALHMAKRFSQVIAFEPAPDTHEALAANIAEFRATEAEAGLIIHHKLALGGHRHTTGMAEDQRYSGGNTGGRYLKGAGDIEVVTLDSFNRESLGFLKLDVEGYEVFALQGAVETLARCKPVVLIEVKPRMAHRFGIDPMAAVDFLVGLGMKKVDQVGSDWIFGW